MSCEKPLELEVENGPFNLDELVQKEIDKHVKKSQDQSMDIERLSSGN